MRSFDDILEEVGSFGPFQITVFILVSIFETPAAWAMFLQVFVSADQPWTCSSLLQYNDTVTNSKELDPANDSYFVNRRYLTVAEHCQLVANGSCGDIIFTGDCTTIISEWNLICDKDYVRPVIMTFQMIGVLVGAVAVGQLADMYGRRNVYFAVYTLLLLVFFGSSFANSWQLYAACRAIIGALIGGTMVVNFVLPLEMVGRQWRTFCGCIGFWACGVMLLALLAYLIRDWRVLSMSCSLIGLPVLLSYWFIPESPRWLIQKGRLEEAEAIIHLIARRNKRPKPDLSQLIVYIKKEEEKQHDKVKLYGFWDLFRNFSMTKNTVIMMYAWFVSGAVYYGTSLNVGNLSGDRYINFFLSGLVEIPALLLVVFVNNRIGRKKTLAVLMSVSGVSCFAILFVDIAGKLEEFAWLTTSLAMIGKSGIAGAWAASQIFAAEVFPTVVRNIGVGVTSMSARVGGIIAPQIVALNKLSKPLPFIIFGALGIVCALLCAFLPETFNMPLPDSVPPRQWCFGHWWHKSVRGQNQNSSPADIIRVNTEAVGEQGLPTIASMTNKMSSVKSISTDYTNDCSDEISTIPQNAVVNEDAIGTDVNSDDKNTQLFLCDETNQVYVTRL